MKYRKTETEKIAPIGEYELKRKTEKIAPKGDVEVRYTKPIKIKLDKK